MTQVRHGADTPEHWKANDPEMTPWRKYAIAPVRHFAKKPNDPELTPWRKYAIAPVRNFVEKPHNSEVTIELGRWAASGYLWTFSII